MADRAAVTGKVAPPPDARILLAQPLDIASLIQACPDLLRQSDTVEWDEAQGTLKAWRRMRIGQLTVSVQPLAKPSEEELHQAMLNGIRDKGLSVLNWTPEAEQFRLRLHCAAKWLPEYDWPAVDEASAAGDSGKLVAAAHDRRTVVTESEISECDSGVTGTA
ncbi:ATP-dependent helicase HrpB [Salmonella enterica subsp. enterica]|uniref:ATP-dependent helicase HrpB n=1 Tax=Salmonella enterica I TaxID=59201 RepID=A0A447MXY9_SALET|nr:ATP-dependent helicase HrpB [Salmonella enterica subsp. enterica]